MPKERVSIIKRSALAPGQMTYVSIDGLPLAVANVAGSFYVFSDSCRHEGASLASGCLIDDTVTCPWHGWIYNVRTGKSIVPPVGLRLQTYAVTIADDDVLIELDWDA